MQRNERITAVLAFISAHPTMRPAQAEAKHRLSTQQARELLAAHAIAFPNQPFPEK